MKAIGEWMDSKRISINEEDSGIFSSQLGKALFKMYGRVLLVKPIALKF